MATRMLLFPIKVLGSIYFEVFEMIPNVQENHYTLWSSFVVLLVMLQLLNWYWFVLICKIAYNGLVNKAVRDERED